jgi:hypothetical protein
MVATIASRVRERRPMTDAELLDKPHDRYGISISGDTLRHIVRDHAQIRSIAGVPMESETVAVDLADIDAGYDELETKVKEIPRDFIFNVHEAGSSEHGTNRKQGSRSPRRR